VARRTRPCVPPPGADHDKSRRGPPTAGPKSLLKALEGISKALEGLSKALTGLSKALKRPFKALTRLLIKVT
jgi:hypothetical protein